MTASGSGGSAGQPNEKDKDKQAKGQEEDAAGSKARRKVKHADDEPEEEKQVEALDEGDIALLKSYGLGPYTLALKQVEKDIDKALKSVNELAGVKESDTGLAHPSLWDLVSDKEAMSHEHALHVARCTKIVNANTDNAKYMITVKQIAKFVVALGERVSPTDIEEGHACGCGPDKVLDHDAASSQDRQVCAGDDGRGKARRDVRRRGRSQGLD